MPAAPHHKQLHPADSRRGERGGWPCWRRGSTAPRRSPACSLLLWLARWGGDEGRQQLHLLSTKIPSPLLVPLVCITVKVNMLFLPLLLIALLRWTAASAASYSYILSLTLVVFFTPLPNKEDCSMTPCPASSEEDMFAVQAII